MLTYLRRQPDTTGGEVVLFGFHGLPSPDLDDGRAAVTAAVQAAVTPLAAARQELADQLAAASSAATAAAAASDRLSREMAAAAATLFGVGLTAHLAGLRRRHATADANYHNHRVTAAAAADGLEQLDNEARAAAATEATAAAAQLASDHRQAADLLARAIFARIADDLGTVFALRDAADFLAVPRLATSAAATVLRSAGFPPAPPRSTTTDPARFFAD